MALHTKNVVFSLMTVIYKDDLDLCQRKGEPLFLVLSPDSNSTMLQEKNMGPLLGIVALNEINSILFLRLSHIVSKAQWFPRTAVLEEHNSWPTTRNLYFIPLNQVQGQHGPIWQTGLCFSKQKTTCAWSVCYHWWQGYSWEETQQAACLGWRSQQLLS